MAVALLAVTAVRRLQKAHPVLFSPSTILSHRLPRPLLDPPFFSQSRSHLPSTFRRTPRVQSAFPPRLADFAPLQYSSTQIPLDPLHFSSIPLESYRELDPPVLELVEGLKRCTMEGEAEALLESTGVEPSERLVCSAIWALRDDWELALLVFEWAQKRGCDKGLDLVVWVLGDQREFRKAWRLIQDSRRPLVDHRLAFMFMMDRYAAADYPSKAIKTFNIMEKFKISADSNAFYTLLKSLCKHGFIEEAKEYMLLNKKFFPLETKGFNIILDGWCNVSFDISEAKRIRKEMSAYCISPDATSYSHLISCFSKVGDLFQTLRLYDEMKKRGWAPGLEVYNSLIYVLTHENCLTEALKVLERIKEAGLQPDLVTFNSLIRPLCEAKKLEDARTILANMIRENISPNTETYHAFLEVENFEGTLEVLASMSNAGCGPNGETFLLVLGKFFKLKQVDNALKIWVEMKQYVVPTSAHYAASVEGLAMCGVLDKAREFYTEMISRGFTDDPKLAALFNRKPRGKEGSNPKLAAVFNRQPRGKEGSNPKLAAVFNRKPRGEEGSNPKLAAVFNRKPRGEEGSNLKLAAVFNRKPRGEEGSNPKLAAVFNRKPRGKEGSNPKLAAVFNRKPRGKEGSNPKLAALFNRKPKPRGKEGSNTDHRKYRRERG